MLSWIQSRAISDLVLLEALSNELDPGEAAAIVLAIELGADKIVIDERRGRSVAERLNLDYIGILGVLIEAKTQGLILEVKPLLDSLVRQAGFWISQPLYESVLRSVEEA